MASLALLPRATLREDWRASGLIALPPIATCAIMGLFAAVAISIARISPWPLLSYFDCAAVTLLCVLVFAFAAVVKCALDGEEAPFSYLVERLGERLPLLILPAIVLPLFLIGYTAAKTAIPLLVGYTWDAYWANVDRAIFGEDVWRISRTVFGDGHIRLWEWCYSVGWGSAFLVTANFVALSARRTFVGIYFTAMLLVWLVGGCFMAYAFSAAGPVFAPAFDASLAARFQPLQDFLRQGLGRGSIGLAQQYLVVAAKETHEAVKGGGISAMPSMHIGTVSIYVLAARRTRWFAPALAFWAIIFIGSGYFGFHYWVDGIVAAALAVGCWWGSEAIYSRLADRSAAAPEDSKPAGS